VSAASGAAPGGDGRRYRGVAQALTAAALAGAVSLLGAGLAVGDVVLLDAAVFAGLAASALLWAASGRGLRPRASDEETEPSSASGAAKPPETRWLPGVGGLDAPDEALAFASHMSGFLCTGACAYLLFLRLPAAAPGARQAAAAAALCLAGVAGANRADQ
jgi:hypothetical protein